MTSPSSEISGKEHKKLAQEEIRKLFDAGNMSAENIFQVNKRHNLCVICGKTCKVQIYRNTGVCSDDHRKEYFGPDPKNDRH